MIIWYSLIFRCVVVIHRARYTSRSLAIANSRATPFGSAWLHGLLQRCNLELMALALYFVALIQMNIFNRWSYLFARTLARRIRSILSCIFSMRPFIRTSSHSRMSRRWTPVISNRIFNVILGVRTEAFVWRSMRVRVGTVSRGFGNVEPMLNLGASRNGTVAVDGSQKLASLHKISPGWHIQQRFWRYRCGERKRSRNDDFTQLGNSHHTASCRIHTTQTQIRLFGLFDHQRHFSYS